MVNPVNKSWIPNIFTLTSLFFGFSSILASVQSVREMAVLALGEHAGISEPRTYLAYAGLFILFAAVLDFMDGMVARALHVSSEFGKQLDSLADLVSCGLAPGVLFYTACLFAGSSLPESGIQFNATFGLPWWFVDNLFLVKLLSFLFPICAVIRLARFNAAPSTPYFSGVPSTFAGGAAALLITFSLAKPPILWIYEKISSGPPPEGLLHFTRWMETVSSQFFLVVFGFTALALLMVSTVRFYKVRYFFKGMKGARRTLVILFWFAAFVLFFQYALMLASAWYFAFSIAKHYWYRRHPDREDYA